MNEIEPIFLVDRLTVDGREWFVADGLLGSPQRIQQLYLPKSRTVAWCSDLDPTPPPVADRVDLMALARYAGLRVPDLDHITSALGIPSRGRLARMRAVWTRLAPLIPAWRRDWEQTIRRVEAMWDLPVDPAVGLALSACLAEAEADEKRLHEITQGGCEYAGAELDRIANSADPITIPALRDLSQRQPAWTPNGTISGRITCSRPNVQSLPGGLSEIDEDLFETLRCRHWLPDARRRCRVALRQFIAAGHGRELVIGDYRQIEPRIIAWLAGEKDLLDRFAEGEDVYQRFADESGFGERDFGKLAVLRLCYGSGPGRLIKDAKKWGMAALTPADAAALCAAYRHQFQEIVAWRAELMDAAVAALRSPGQRHLVRESIAFEANADFLKLTLPSGREIRYFRPALVGNEISHGLGDRLWWGSLTAHVVQGVGADLLSEAMGRIEDVVAVIYDELIVETEEGALAPDDLVALMTAPTQWSSGLPLDARAFSTPRWRK